MVVQEEEKKDDEENGPQEQELLRATWMHLVVPSAAAVGFWQERTLLYMKNTNNKFVTSDMCTCDLNVTNMDLILIIIILIT